VKKQKGNARVWHGYPVDMRRATCGIQPFVGRGVVQRGSLRVSGADSEKFRLTKISAYGWRGKLDSCVLSSSAASIATASRDPKRRLSCWADAGTPVMGSRRVLRWATDQDGLILRSEPESADLMSKGMSGDACVESIAGLTSPSYSMRITVRPGWASRFAALDAGRWRMSERLRFTQWTFLVEKAPLPFHSYHDDYCDEVHAGQHRNQADRSGKSEEVLPMFHPAIISEHI
jgi:hypothetical protein